MPQETENDRNPWRIGISILITVAFALLAILHILSDIQIDSAGVVPIFAAAIPWIFPYVRSIDILGYKFELINVEEEVARQQKIINDLVIFFRKLIFG